MTMTMTMNPLLTGAGAGVLMMTQSWRQIKLPNSSLSNSISGRFKSFSTKSGPVKIGIPEFLAAIGKIYERHRAKKKNFRINKLEKKQARTLLGNIEQHAQLLESKFGDIHKLVQATSSQLKEHDKESAILKLGIRPQHRKLILRYANKYRLGLWRP